MTKEVKNQILEFISKSLDDINIREDEPISVNAIDEVIEVSINVKNALVSVSTKDSNGKLGYFNILDL